MAQMDIIMYSPLCALQDSEEESRAVVEEFFQHTKSPEQEKRRELREIYRQRRKNSNGEEGNNW